MSERSNPYQDSRTVSNLETVDPSRGEAQRHSIRSTCDPSALPCSNHVLYDPEITANLYCNFAYLYWEGCVILQHIFAVTYGPPRSRQPDIVQPHYNRHGRICDILQPNPWCHQSSTKEIYYINWQRTGKRRLDFLCSILFYF